MSNLYLTRQDAAEYLSARLGRKITVGALHRMASDGTGCHYHIVLGRASYLAKDLDAWIDGLAKAPTKKRPRASSLPRDHAAHPECPPTAA